MATRREFIERSAAGMAGLGATLPLDLSHLTGVEPASPVQDESWNLAWPTRITGRHRALFDVAEPESGYGVWRASAWAGQYINVLKVKPTEISTVIVLRHNGIVLALQNAFWDKYGLGKAKSVTHPLTQEPIARNPALLDEKDGIPAPFNEAGLGKQIARGAIVLACNLALQDCIELVKKTSGVSDEAARKEALAALVPGVILQPSGVFAAVRAQEAGCAYVKAS